MGQGELSPTLLKCLPSGLGFVEVVTVVQCTPMRVALFKVVGPDFAHGQGLELVGSQFCGLLGLTLALQFAWVIALVKGHAQLVGLIAGGFNLNPAVGRGLGADVAGLWLGASAPGLPVRGVRATTPEA